VYAAAQTALGRTMRLGGASALVDFIVGKVKPRIREQYRVDPGNEGLLGHSGMGAFVGYALFARPGAFTHYVIGSPAFVQNDWEVFDLEERYAAEHDDLPAKIYLSAGALEVRDYALLQIVSGAARLAETLYHRGYPSLELEAEILSGKRHTTSAIEMMERALEYFWPGTPLQMSPEGTKALFEASTKRAERTW
jgi:predicted alpha/beta superfamily hydrolase